MAVTTVKNLSSLRIKLDCGIGENSKTIIRSKTFANVKPDALNDDLFEVAKAILTLQDHDLFSLAKLDNTSITE